jgi:hypothetical protein
VRDRERGLCAKGKGRLNLTCWWQMRNDGRLQPDLLYSFILVAFLALCIPSDCLISLCRGHHKCAHLLSSLRHFCRNRTIGICSFRATHNCQRRTPVYIRSFIHSFKWMLKWLPSWLLKSYLITIELRSVWILLLKHNQWKRESKANNELFRSKSKSKLYFDRRAVD